MASNSTKASIAQKEIPGALQVLPNTPTDVTTMDTWLFQVVLNNKTAGAVTVTITDNAGTPLDLLTAVSIAANTAYVIAFPEGQYMPGGFKWSASAATSINGSVKGFRES